MAELRLSRAGDGATDREWVAEVATSVDDPDPVDFGPAAASKLETVGWRGYELRVPPLELQLEVAERRGLTDRVTAIREWADPRKLA